MKPRHTARALVMHDSQLLLMERWRQGKHYFSIPGGKIEPGETPKETAVREVLEETGCNITIERPVYVMTSTDGSKSTIYIGKYISGEPQLPTDSPEALENDPNNRFKPAWVPLVELSSLPYLVWQPIMDRFFHDMAHGFPSQPVEIIAPPLP